MPDPTPLFIAVGHHGQRLASRDGAVWEHLQVGREGETYRAVAFGNDRFVAVGSYGGENITAATTDGKAWKTGKKDARYVQYIRGLTFGNSAFLGLGGDPGSVGSSKPFITTSQDGITWSENESIPGKHILRRAAWGDKRFVAVGDRGRRATSEDAKTWNDAPDAKAIDTLVDVTFGNPGGKPIFIGVGLHGLRMSSGDGVKWSEAVRGEEGEHLNSIIWARDRFVAVGMGATYFSQDGNTWKREKNTDAPLSVAYGTTGDKKDIFVGSNWKGRLLHSADAITWKQTHQCEHHVESIAFGSV